MYLIHGRHKKLEYTETTRGTFQKHNVEIYRDSLTVECKNFAKFICGLARSPHFLQLLSKLLPQRRTSRSDHVVRLTSSGRVVFIGGRSARRSLRAKSSRPATTDATRVASFGRPATSPSTFRASRLRSRRGSLCTSRVFPRSLRRPSRGLNVTVLELRSVELGRLDPSETENPFAGLEDTLRKLTFSLGTMPSSWSLLSGLRRLEELEILHYARLKLTRDFNHLPKSLRTLFIADATFESIEGGWISDLVNLEHLIFRGTGPGQLQQELAAFAGASLHHSRLAVRLGDNLPALNYVSVFKNLITMLREQDLAPIRDKVAVVDLMFNPVHCDCNVSFILDYPTSWHYFACAGPRDVKGTYATNLQYKQLKCEGTA
ncbi:hypothetical protein MTO96_003397 [Rhipicephalus appendiculatus]